VSIGGAGGEVREHRFDRGRTTGGSELRTAPVHSKTARGPDKKRDEVKPIVDRCQSNLGPIGSGLQKDNGDPAGASLPTV